MHEPQTASSAMTEAAALTSRLANALSAAGYDPLQIEVQVDRDESGQLVLRLLADVPGLSEADLLAMLVAPGPRPQQPKPAGGSSSSSSPRSSRRKSLLDGASGWLGRLIAGVVLGLALGVVGLPGAGPPIRLPWPVGGQQSASLGPNTTESSSEAQAAPTIASGKVLLPTPESTPEKQKTPTPAPAPPTPTAVARLGPEALFAERLVTPLPGWPNDPQGTAWFGDGGYRLFARQAGRFVAVGVPLGAPARDVLVTAHIRKLNGPSGGGYGIVLRDQGPTDARDGRNQDGRFLVLEVGDEGDVGIWQRDQGRWIDVLPWTHSEAVHTGSQPNELVARSIGTRLQLDVNGTRVADMVYTGLPPDGGVGIFAGGDLNEVVLDWLRIDAISPST